MPMETTTPPRAPRPRYRALGNLEDVKRALARCLRKLEHERLESGKARAMIYGLSVLGGLMAHEDHETWLRGVPDEVLTREVERRIAGQPIVSGGDGTTGSTTAPRANGAQPGGMV